MLVQEYQEGINKDGEVSYMLFGGKFTHAVLKKAKGDDFRVQDDFGGSVHDHSPSQVEIHFAEHIVNVSRPGIPYARVDIMRDNRGDLTLGELELFEPELWFRKYPPAADIFADIIWSKYKNR
jgi:glutathione synthase/RimK-type ligase-like ATP-grasp enzyme